MLVCRLAGTLGLKREKKHGNCLYFTCAMPELGIIRESLDEFESSAIAGASADGRGTDCLHASGEAIAYR